MARKQKLNNEQIGQIRQLFADGATGKQVASQFAVSILTAYKVKNYQGVYGPSPAELAARDAYQPVLDATGTIIGLTQGNIIPEGAVVSVDPD